MKKQKILRYADSFTKYFRNFPVSLHVEITDRCFNQCPMCGHWKRDTKADLELDRFRDYVVYGKNNGLESVCLSGGDPLALENINTVMRFLSGFVAFGVVTAGYVPDHVSMDLLRKAQWVRVSLDAIEEETYNKVRGGVIYAFEVKNSIEKMLKAGVNVELGVTVHKLNVDEIVSIFAYAKRVGIKKISARTVYSHSSGLALNQGELRTAASACRNYGVRFTHSFTPKPAKRCWASNYQHFIRANGDVYPCCILAGDTESAPKFDVKFGNIDYSRYDIIQSAAMKFAANFPKLLEVKEMCNAECIQRLNYINTIVERTIGERNFF